MRQCVQAQALSSSTSPPPSRAGAAVGRGHDRPRPAAGHVADRGPLKGQYLLNDTDTARNPSPRPGPNRAPARRCRLGVSRRHPSHAIPVIIGSTSLSFVRYWAFEAPGDWTARSVVALVALADPDRGRDLRSTVRCWSRMTTKRPTGTTVKWFIQLGAACWSRCQRRSSPTGRCVAWADDLRIEAGFRRTMRSPD